MLCKRNTGKHKRLKKFCFVLVCALAVLIALFETQAIPFTAKCVKKQSESVSTRLISETVREVQEELGLDYDDLAAISYSAEGDVKAISINSRNINNFKSEVTNRIQNELDKDKLYSFALPIGSFTDMSLFSTFGPNIEVTFALTGFVNCKVNSSFESAGVNQTVHHITLTVNTEIITLSPEYREKTKFKTDFEIAQTVIVGSVPSTFADIVR